MFIGFFVALLLAIPAVSVAQTCSVLTPFSKIVVLVGPPGSGKGTQAKNLAELLNIPHVVMSDLLREAAQQPTALAEEIRTALRTGHLVRREVARAVIEQKLQSFDSTHGYLLDGAPRDLESAGDLEEVLQSLGRQLDYIIYLDVPDEEILLRLSGRLLCSSCPEIYHAVRKPPQRLAICDVCGQPLVRRLDDAADIARERLRIYHAQTEPMIRAYAGQKRVFVAPFAVSAAQVTHSILQFLGQAN